MGNDETDDAVLWSRSLEGEGEAFGALYDRHRGRVFRHAHRLSVTGMMLMTSRPPRSWNCGDSGEK
jgi:hypothetical protein